MKECSPVDIGKRLSRLRRSYKDASGKKLSQESLAKKLGFSREQIAKFESGRQSLAPDQISSISQFFGITTDQLITGIKSENQAVANELGLNNDSIEFLKALSEAEGDKPFPIRWTDGYAPGEDLYGTSPAKNFDGTYTVESVYPSEILQLVNWLLSHTEGHELLAMLFTYLFTDEDNCWLSIRSENYQKEKALYPSHEFDVIFADRNHQTLIEPEMMVAAMKIAADSKLNDIRRIIKEERKG